MYLMISARTLMRANINLGELPVVNTKEIGEKEEVIVYHFHQAVANVSQETMTIDPATNKTAKNGK